MIESGDIAKRVLETGEVKACQTTGFFCHRDLKMCVIGYRKYCRYQKLENNATYTCLRNWNDSSKTTQ